MVREGSEDEEHDDLRPEVALCVLLTDAASLRANCILAADTSATPPLSTWQLALHCLPHPLAIKGVKTAV
jgi:hypothetical protein